MKHADVNSYARKLLLAYVNKFSGEWVLVRRGGKDVEPLHRMRVASRRLRSALHAFAKALPAKETSRWRKVIRQIGRLLGEARELDIHLRILQDFKIKPRYRKHAGSLQQVICRVEEKRSRIQKRVSRVLGYQYIGKEISGLSVYLRQFPSLSKSLTREAFVVHQNKAVRKRLKELRALRAYAYQPKRVRKLHRMRIATKKLRYTLEVYQPLSEVDLRKFIRASQQIQDDLGSMHEFVVLGNVLSGLANASRGTGSVKKTIQLLEAECDCLRAAYYDKFLRHWKKIEKVSTWETLGKMLQ